MHKKCAGLVILLFMFFLVINKRKMFQNCEVPGINEYFLSPLYIIGYCHDNNIWSLYDVYVTYFCMLEIQNCPFQLY